MNATEENGFVLLGLTDHPELLLPLFIVILLIYITIMSGNVLIFIVVMVDPSLHAPMYFFLQVLSIMDIGYSSVTLPRLLIDFLSKDKTITFLGCATQMFFIIFWGSSECYLLAVMAYDRYVAICRPLRYMNIMNKTICFALAVLSCFAGNVVAMLQTAWIFTLPFCGPRHINYLFCDIPPLIKLSCNDTSFYETQLFTATILVIFTPFSLIVLSYVLIICNILKMTSVGGFQKAFSTCFSHLMVVFLYYGSGTLIYLHPKSSNVQDSNKLLALMDTAITPMLNPIIYSLRNKEINIAIKKLLSKTANRIHWK